MLLPVGALYRRENLPRDSELGERTKRGLLVEVEVPDCLEQADHALLDHVFSVGAGQEVGAGLGAREVPIAGEQDLDGSVVAATGLLDKLDVFESVELERWSDQIRCPVFIPLPRE